MLTSKQIISAMKMRQALGQSPHEGLCDRNKPWLFKRKEVTETPKERRFRGIQGWAPNTDYISIRGDQGFVVHKDGSEVPIHAYNLAYCIAQVAVGNWEELCLPEQK